MSQKALYFITGSSGSGKTTLVRQVVAAHPGLRAFHVDDPGVKENARAWVERAASANSELLVVEGQERPHLVLARARELGIKAVNVVLIDCGHAERRRRLLEDRQQPELDHLDMYAWAAYLRGQADALGLEIIDTTDKTVADCVSALASSIASLRARRWPRTLKLQDLVTSLRSFRGEFLTPYPPFPGSYGRGKFLTPCRRVGPRSLPADCGV